MIKLKRLSDRPILEPVKEHEWERKAVFNCSAIYDNGLFHLIYRATDIGPHVKYGKYISRLGYAVSKDGINFMRLDKPVLSNDVEQELRGCEDPRIVKIDDTYYMMYTGFGNRTDDDYRICLATSKNLINWERKGVVLDEPNKDAALFPEKINGNYVMFHRRYPDIWLAYSNDLKNWFNHKSIIKPIKGTWESSRVGVAGPPIRIKDGWFLIYHAADDDNVYRLGAALLDINDPSIVLARQEESILEPELEWEKNGFISNVVFSCGNAVKGDDIYVYYGGADTVIGVAYLNMNDIKFD
ncbi:glycosidase-related [Thermoanaerobacterium thermosaccharolyticum DSM 571]|uniref:Glycosidase-related n=1 Tax=Thermoanaerobacterium thermosaccharolyticum (strain ATCC 7956 / DSM 571 / NCIMB 9385 / NCA 3814 / NCTC 13789 / WDCM 00135 / 2032) TaxID=580327 RepID=D9TT15_THETC|nr:glycosidase [Thermoanaerobacterium thermosaccharolyticum]ADL69413.1 glycosidase-related [Thermoanaerobacterium thermosaccharolyticum DSM 571]